MIITVIGAESTGKTTLSLDLATELSYPWICEYARPYLESQPTPEVTLDRMAQIWAGQARSQIMAKQYPGDVIQDTDLFATLGYWLFWQPETVGVSLEASAKFFKSDLYLVTKSNIPFAPDPLRFGGDVRESTDEYWTQLLDRYRLNYQVIESSDRDERRKEAMGYVGDAQKV